MSDTTSSRVRGTTSSKERLRDTLLDRLTDGSERHAQRWHLRLPDDNEPASTVRPLLVVLGLPTLGLAFAMAMLTTYGPVVLLGLTPSPPRSGHSSAARAPSPSSCRWPRG